MCSERRPWLPLLSPSPLPHRLQSRPGLLIFLLFLAARQACVVRDRFEHRRNEGRHDVTGKNAVVYYRDWKNNAAASRREANRNAIGVCHRRANGLSQHHHYCCTIIVVVQNNITISYYYNVNKQNKKK